MERDLHIDEVDRKILCLLMDNAGMAYTEVAKKVHVSVGTIHVRMKKMEGLGIIKGTQLIIDYARLGFDITAFLGIYLEKSSFYDEALSGLKLIPEIVDVNYTTGNYSMFVKLICRDTQHLRSILHDKIQKVSGIQRTETFISLEQSIARNIKF